MIRDGYRKRRLLREVNERIHELNPSFGHTSSCHLFCECVREDCSERVVVPRAVYDRLRGDPGLFLVAPGHERRRRERVIARTDAYCAVTPRSPRRASGRGAGAAVPTQVVRAEPQD